MVSQRLQRDQQKRHASYGEGVNFGSCDFQPHRTTCHPKCAPNVVPRLLTQSLAHHSLPPLHTSFLSPCLPAERVRPSLCPPPPLSPPARYALPLSSSLKVCIATLNSSLPCLSVTPRPLTTYPSLALGISPTPQLSPYALCTYLPFPSDVCHMAHGRE